VNFSYHREILEGSPLDVLFVATTDDRGAFSFDSFGPDSWLRLRVTAPDGRVMRVKAQAKAEGAVGPLTDEHNYVSTPRLMDLQRFVSTPQGKETRLIIYPATRVNGRVVTKLPGVSVSDLRISLTPSRAREDRSACLFNFGGITRTDASGIFSFVDLCDRTIDIFVSAAEDGSMNRADSPWTVRAAQGIELKSGGSNEALIELIRGVEVTGKVLTSDGQPLKRANVGIQGPMQPRSIGRIVRAITDTEGRYRYRLPGGEIYVYVMGHPPGHADRNVKVPDGVDRFEVPPIVMNHVLVERGRVRGVAGNPVPGAVVTCVGERGRISGPGVGAVTDAQGEFTLSPNPNNSIPVGQAARLLIRLPDGAEHEVEAIPTTDGSVAVELPASNGSPPRASSLARPAASAEHPEPHIIITEHVLLWDDRIVTWDEVLKRLRAMRSRGQFRATFHTSNGLHRVKDGWKDYHDRIMATYCTAPS
jgi:hypothetical protein